jgi:chromosome segregation ATPase
MSTSDLNRHMADARQRIADLRSAVQNAEEAERQHDPERLAAQRNYCEIARTYESARDELARICEQVAEASHLARHARMELQRAGTRLRMVRADPPLVTPATLAMAYGAALEKARTGLMGTL